MDASFKDAALAILLAQHAAYEELYKACANTDTPAKKAWLSSLDTSGVDKAEIESIYDPVIEFAGSEDITPEEMVVLLQVHTSLTNKIREWLSGMYWGIKRSSDDGAPTPEAVKAQLQLVNDAFKAALSYTGMGVLTIDDIKTALPENTENANVRSDKDGNPQTVFRYKPVGTVRVKKTEGTVAHGPRSNTKKYRLVYDGEVVQASDGKLGEACRLKGFQVSEFQKLVTEKYGKTGWTDPKHYEREMVVLNGHSLGLVPSE